MAGRLINLEDLSTHLKLSLFKKEVNTITWKRSPHEFKENFSVPP
jgi:hypothetical protein